LHITPALYGVAQARNINLTGKEGNALRTYIKIAYCAAINEWEIRQVDEPDLGDFPYKYEDFEEWAWADMPRFTRLIDDILKATTGKGIRDYTNEKKKR